MKILVSIKRVIDYHVKIRVKTDQSGVETTNVKMAINPFDAIAVEQAVRLKEAGIASEVIVVSIGTESCQETLRYALALGADRAILVDNQQCELQPLAVAKILKALILQESPQLVILGKQAIDDDCNQTGQMLAGLLNWPQGTFISQLKIENQTAIVTREVDGGLEMLSLDLPAVITTDLRLNEPRFASLPNIMQAKKKSLTTLTVEQLAVDITPRLATIKISEPPQRKSGIRVNSVEELLQLLFSEQRVSL